jgi:predicted RecA/RadA family phage recombinase
MMASFKYGKPVMVKNNVAANYSGGDVVVIGSVPFVAHEDNPAWSGGALAADAFA